ncbi:FAD-dependent oxidoreductase [Curvibacter sp. CHRR-16]|uniref:NAD(P)/FAD-dependent oxidoreductase n=1 Tax=Curvibacter sp. CHRR-16 TaxID=2835872 RepID=UPI001BDB4BFA|nr:FAD-dependent oxidoreductase [Curvibacter sp. CHRR-16]MBT0570867.1 FAD-dependent oxidoreductase [Curvibacter sp. CHRR-16]
MKIAVIGAGIAGITTAYRLSQEGHQVCVFERRAGVCEETSFANLGLSSNANLLTLQTLSSNAGRLGRFWEEKKSLQGSGNWHKPLLRWLWQRAKHSPKVEPSLISLQRYSAQLHADWSSLLKLETEHTVGQIILISDEQAMPEWLTKVEALKAAGISANVLSADDVRKREPALHATLPLSGGIWLPGDQVTNSRQFAIQLRNEALKNGVVFQFQQEITTLEPGAKVRLGTADGQSHSFDHAVICTQQLPAFSPVKTNPTQSFALLDSYTATVPIKEALNAPNHVIHDAASRITISRLGNRLRIQGGMHHSAPDRDPHPATVQQLYNTLDNHFPGAANYPAGTQTWRGVCCFSSDSMPVVGLSSATGISLNLAHGMHGWSLACACADLLAHQIVRKDFPLDARLLAPQRLGL